MQRYITRYRQPYQSDLGGYAVLDLDTSKDVTKGYQKATAEHLAECFNANNQTVIRRFHVDHGFDDIADTLTPKAKTEPSDRDPITGKRRIGYRGIF
jgi:hypothetical protein